MNEKEFLKEHPSLDKKIFSEIEAVTSGMTGTQWVRCVIGKSKEIVELKKNNKVITIQDIHKTQLDKIKVKEVIDNMELCEDTKHWSGDPHEPIGIDLSKTKKQLIKELGVEDK